MAVAAQEKQMGNNLMEIFKKNKVFSEALGKHNFYHVLWRRYVEQNPRSVEKEKKIQNKNLSGYVS